MRCKTCQEQKPKGDFSSRQWYKKEGDGACQTCMRAGKEKQCVCCGESKTLSDFVPVQWQADDPKCRVCAGQKTRGAKGTWKCEGCQESKPHSSFTKCAKSSRGTKRGRCDTCVAKREEEEKAQSARSQKHVTKRPCKR